LIFINILAKRSKNFKKLCRKFRSLTLECAPKLIKKFSENKSYCDSKQRKFFWTIKFNFYSISKNTSKILLDDSLKRNFKNYQPERIFVLHNLSVQSHIFEDPIDDSIHNLKTLFKFLLDNKNLLNFDLILQIKENFEKIDDLLFLMRINMEPHLAIFEEERNFNNNSNYKIKKNQDKEVFRIKDAFYAPIDKDLLIKDLLMGRYIHEYPEFEIFNIKIIENI